MKLLRTEDEFLNASALLAIHSAISYNDALRVGLDDYDLSADDHLDAAGDLEKLLATRRFDDRAGLKHLRGLLKKKSLVAYGSHHLNVQDFRDLVTKAERFEIWANKVGRELKIEGWRDDGE